MAYLFNHQSQTRCYLYAYHNFGRFAYSVDTLITNPRVSKMHAVIEWHNQQWFIRDLSSNGTWLNKKKLTKQQPKSLKVGDEIRFSNDDDIVFTVGELNPPSVKLIPYPDSNQEQCGDPKEAISLQPYHLLPNESEPEIALILNQVTGQWRIEYINEPQLQPRSLLEHDIVEFDNQRWQFQLSHLADSTEIQAKPQLNIDDIQCLFELSLDEEITKLTVKSAQGSIDLQSRSHHYLTLNLARYRVADAEKDLPIAEQGWINTDCLLRDLGVDMSYLNIQIHRSRKQFTELLTNVINAEDLIERQLRRVRFGCPTFKIYKGQKLECSLSPSSGSLVQTSIAPANKVVS